MNDRRQFPRITFGIIVLNGEPFTRYCLRSLYPFAHEIIVVEGGHEKTTSVCTPDGHSRDGTLQALYEFKKNEDPENKIQIVTRNGFWPQKDELGKNRTIQSRAYAERATGDYLWQVDIDEFYKPEDMRRILTMLETDPSITTVSFKRLTFWGSPDYLVDGWNISTEEVHRIFKWAPGYRYLTHEPPTVLDREGRDLRTLHYMTGTKMKRRGIYQYHYAVLFPKQMREKALLYQEELDIHSYDVLKAAEELYCGLTRPYYVDPFAYPSWLEHYHGAHPPEFVSLWDDVAKGLLKIERRPISDVERLLQSRRYSFGRAWRELRRPLRRQFHRGRLAIWRVLPEAPKRAIRRIVGIR
jgi:glycosyltransferase involved in cell wall biosynthesis